jgi:CBS domain-containing protein
MAIARDVMTTDVLTAQPDETVAGVAGRMAERGVGAALVLSGESLAGIFTERDLLVRVIAPGKDPAATAVGDVASANPTTVSTDTHLRRCAEILREKRYRHLPVVEGGVPVGVISARDFFEQVTGEFEHFFDQRRYQDQLQAHVDPYESLGGAYRA